MSGNKMGGGGGGIFENVTCFTSQINLFLYLPTQQCHRETMMGQQICSVLWKFTFLLYLNDTIDSKPYKFKLFFKSFNSTLGTCFDGVFGNPWHERWWSAILC